MQNLWCRMRGRGALALMAGKESPRAAATAMFLLNGALFGTWASRVPAFVERFDLSSSNLGQLLFGMAGGAVLAFPFAGRLSDRLGAGVLCRWAGAGYILALWCIGLSSTLWAFGASLVVFGATQGALDVGMNSMGAEVEQRRGRPIMSSLHAMFSLGAGAGALGGYFAVFFGLDPSSHFALVGTILGAPALALTAGTWPSATVKQPQALALPRVSLPMVGLIAFCATLGEGAMADWSAVFLQATTQATESQSALGYAAFSAAMVVMRFAGDWIIGCWGPARVARLSGILVVFGVLSAVMGNSVSTAILGFLLMGVGYAVIAPLAFSRAAAEPGRAPGSAIASVAMFGYGGLLAGPPLIGFIASAGSLQQGFLVLAVLAMMIVALAAYLEAPSPANHSAKKADAPVDRLRIESL